MSSLTQEERVYIEEAIERGASVRGIAQDLGVPRGRVRWYLDHRPATAHERPLEGAFRAVVYDIETTRFKSDLGALIAAAFLDLGTGIIEWRNIDSFSGSVVERERALACWAAEQYTAADMLIGHNIVAFDKNFLNGVLVRHGFPRLPRRIQGDTYLAAHYGLKGLLHSYSLASMADFFRCEEAKDRPSIHDWRESALDVPESVDRITQRCLRDVQLNAKVWKHLKPFFFEWRGQ